jgi:hypothetical protein
LVLLTERALGELLRGFRHNAFRFEIRDQYNSDVGREPFRKYLAGEPDDYAWHRWWMDMVRNDRAAGKAWWRVRIVSVPLSDWSRYALEVARLSVQAGEDIRYLRRNDAGGAGIVPNDSWLFDDDQLVHLHFNDQDDTFVGAELVADDSIVQQHLAWRAAAWQQAQSIDEFVASLP